MSRIQPFVDTPRHRFFKYLFLLALGILHLYLFAIFYSNYATRRIIEESLAQLGTGETFETLLFDARAGADIVREAERQRCLQRDQITLYQLASMNVRQDLSDLFAATSVMRLHVAEFVRAHPKVFDIAETQKSLDQVWGLPLLSELKLSNPLGGYPEGVEEEIRKLIAAEVAELTKKLGRHDKVGGAVETLKRLNSGAERPAEAVKELWDEWHKLDQRLFRATNLDALETALQRLKAEYARVGLDEKVRRNLLIRRLAADETALPRGSEPNLLGEFIGTMDGARRRTDVLEFLACETRDQSLTEEIRSRMQAALEVPPAGPGLWAAYRTLRGQAATLLPPTPVDTAVQKFIRASTATQTLVIAMLFGSLGALCLQALRLSRSGYWGSQSDPHWGEILMSIVLGMGAALIVYVLASLGNQLIADTSRSAQVAPVGAGLVAILGFVSGLLNDDAFGRIRRFGQGWFRSDTNAAGDINLTGVDADFVSVLRDAGFERFAELALVHLVGTRLANKDRFTLFVPKDTWFDTLPLAQWLRLRDATASKAFDGFLDRHLSTADTMDEAELRAQAARGDAVAMADGSQFTLATPAGGDVTLGGKPLDVAAVRVWRTGAIVPIDVAL